MSPIQVSAVSGDARNRTACSLGWKARRSTMPSPKIQAPVTAGALCFHDWPVCFLRSASRTLSQSNRTRLPTRMKGMTPRSFQLPSVRRHTGIRFKSSPSDMKPAGGAGDLACSLIAADFGARGVTSVPVRSSRIYRNLRRDASEGLFDTVLYRVAD